VPSELAPEDELRVFERGLAALEGVLSARPTGYRAPGWSLSERTVDILLSHDFDYDSSMMASDYHPYWCRVGDKAQLDEPYEFGRQVPVVELPVAWHLDDVPFFSFVMAPGGTFQGLRNPADVYEIWKGEFDYLYQEERNGVFLLTMHPEVIGHGHRLPMLRKLLEHISTHPDVQFSTCAEYVRKWRAGNELAV
jgi:peptidoglycan/xylan/chitin deacetylase (PgdA/CDA1 family)